MAELVDAADLKSADSNIVRVQVPLRPPIIITPWFNQGVLYYATYSPACFNTCRTASVVVQL